MWKVQLFMRSGSAIALQHPMLTPSEIRKKIESAETLGGKLALEGKTDSGGDVKCEVWPGAIEAWVAVEMPSGRVAIPISNRRPM